MPELEAAKPAKSSKPKPAAKKSDEAEDDTEEAAPAPKKAPPPASPDGTDRGPNYRALTLAGIGVASIGVGAVMGLKYSSANSDAEKVCPSSYGCSIKEIQTHDKLVEKSRTDRTWSYVGFGVGGAFLAGAGLLWYVQRPSHSSSATWQATPVVAADGSVGALLNGRF